MIMRQNQNQTAKNKSIWVLLTALCLVGAVICLAVVGCGKANSDKVEGELDKLAQDTTVQTPTSEPDTSASESTEPEEPTLMEKDLLFLEEQGIPVPDKTVDIAKLKMETNSDIYAWIYVPDTQIDYPVLQHPTDNTYYLNYNIDGSKGYPGCIYTENHNAKDFTDFNTVLYGHNMKNGSMFANLHKFEDAEFFEEHPYVYIYTEERLLVYEVFASYEFSNVHLLLGYDQETEYGINKYLEEIKNLRDMGRNMREDIFPDAQKRIITLSTCIKTKPNNRYLVQGVLLNED